VGGTKDAAELADVLTHHHDLWIVFECLTKSTVNGLHHHRLSHLPPPHSLRSSVSAAPRRARWLRRFASCGLALPGFPPRRPTGRAARGTCGSAAAGLCSATPRSPPVAGSAEDRPRSCARRCDTSAPR